MKPCKPRKSISVSNTGIRYRANTYNDDHDDIRVRAFFPIENLYREKSSFSLTAHGSLRTNGRCSFHRYIDLFTICKPFDTLSNHLRRVGLPRRLLISYWKKSFRFALSSPLQTHVQDALYSFVFHNNTCGRSNGFLKSSSLLSDFVYCCRAYRNIF